MPVGWGDTYFQSIAGQAFDITSVPNGTYYIEIIANPEQVLHESNTRNDVSLRKVILGGTPGHRTVKVPAWHGIDPETLINDLRVAGRRPIRHPASFCGTGRPAWAGDCSWPRGHELRPAAPFRWRRRRRRRRGGGSWMGGLVDD